MARSYSFAILQAVPDRTRGERVNVGVVVGTPDGVDLRTPEMRKLQILSGHEWQGIVDAYGQRLSKEFASAGSLSELRERIGAISEIFTLSDMGTLLADDEKIYEQRIAAILRTYVNRPTLTRQQKQQKIRVKGPR